MHSSTGMLADSARAFTEAHFAFSSPLPTWVLAAVAAVAVVVLVWYAMGLRRKVSGRWRTCLTAMRAGAVALILIFLLNPSIVEQRVLKLVPTLAVLIDTSQSLNLHDGEEGPTRLAQLRDLVNGGTPSLLDTLSRDYRLDVYTFGADLGGGSPGDVGDLEAMDGGTDIFGSLGEVLTEHSAEKLAGVLLVSDGRDTTGKAAEEFLQTVGVPLATVPLGDPSRYRDVWIGDLEYSEFAFVHKPVTLDVTVESRGYRGTALPIVLKQEGRVLSAKVVHAPSSEFRETVRLGFVPDEVGDYAFSVSVSPQAGEAISENNSVEFRLSVVRDKIRVLMVSGAPSWNYRFLRAALKSDPTVDLLSFVILRSAWDEVNVPQKELSLIPFPTERLFAEELGSFDVVLFDDFSFSFDLPPLYMNKLRDFVWEGGGLGFFGGQRAFFHQDFYGTPMADLLPVELDARSGVYEISPVRMELTAEGEAHPITRLSSDPEENRAIWNSLPELEGINKVARAKEAAVVLGVYPGSGEAGRRYPLLASWKYGEGRSLVLLSDDFWKWNFQMVGKGRSNKYYLNLARQMVRWLVKDPQVNQVNLFVNRARLEPGEEVEITVTALHDDFSPAPEAALDLVMKAPGGSEVPLAYMPGHESGEFVASYRPSREGFHRASVEARAGDRVLGTSTALFEVRASQMEILDGSPDHDLLRRIAEKTGGRFITPEELKAAPLARLGEVFDAAPIYQVVREERTKLWNRWWVFVLFLSLLSAEWWLRRMVGLL